MLDSELYSVSTSLSSKQDVIMKAAASRLVMTVKNIYFHLQMSLLLQVAKVGRLFFYIEVWDKFYINL